VHWRGAWRRSIATLGARRHEGVALVTEEAARPLHADAAMTARFDAPGVAAVVADWALPGPGRQHAAHAAPEARRTVPL
jgi:hypothetical protein